MSNRYYGEYYAPGDEWEDIENLRVLFRKKVKYLPLQIVGRFDTAYLSRYSITQEDEEKENALDEESYQSGRGELEAV